MRNLCNNQNNRSPWSLSPLLGEVAIEKVKELLLFNVLDWKSSHWLKKTLRAPSMNWAIYSHSIQSHQLQKPESQTAGGWIYSKGTSLHGLQYLYSPLSLLHWTLPWAEVLNLMAPWSSLVVLFLDNMLVNTSRYFILHLDSLTNVFMKREDKKFI